LFLTGVNGAGKTTQLQIIMGRLLPDSGEVVKARRNMRIAYLAQEFDVQSGRTVREEFYSVYDMQVKVGARRAGSGGGSRGWRRARGRRGAELRGGICGLAVLVALLACCVVRSLDPGFPSGEVG
jgi:ABC-type phosphonate transport system ATPase subunit